MKTILPFLFLFFYVFSFAQLVNDECDGAIELQLFHPSACPDSSPNTSTFHLNNDGATFSSPFIPYLDCIGGDVTYPSADVWFVFEATSNTIEITLTGLLASNIVLYLGDDCQNLYPIECATTMSETLGLYSAAIDNGSTYYIKVSSNNQSDFDLVVESSRFCTSCLTSSSFAAFPPPIDGRYDAGTSVTYCFTVEDWLSNAAGTSEWMHSLEIEFGAGWDLSSIDPMPPPPCVTDGYWAWYDNWQSCVTGIEFGPGFAFDSNDVSCDGTPLDGDPGNNWGDYCSTSDTSNLPKLFCWTITVRDDLLFGALESLNVTARLYSDGDSGSWANVGCNSGAEYTYFAAVNSCINSFADYELSHLQCSSDCNGNIEISEGILADSSYSFVVIDDFGFITYECIDCPPPLIAENICVGDYRISLADSQGNCFTAEVTINAELQAPILTISTLNTFCAGEPVFMQANSSENIVSYSWTGPNGYTSSSQALLDATDEGLYTVVGIGENGCESIPVSFEVVFNQTQTEIILTGSDTICRGDTISLLAFGGNSFYVWNVPGAGNPLIVSPDSTTTYYLSITDEFGCHFVKDTTIYVEQKGPDLPLVTCTGSYGSVEFSWIPVDSNFTIQIENLTGQDGTQTDSSYVVENLMEGDTVTILLEVLNALGCGNNIELTCISSVCEDAAVLAITPPGQICLGGGQGDVDLEVEINGALMGTGIWSGEGIIDSITGIFSPEVAGVDFHNLMYTWTADTCLAMASTLVLVTENLPLPVLECTATENTILFSWDEVNGAESYEVEILSGQTGTLTLEDRTILFENLGIGEEVSISLTAISDGSCGTSSTELTCQTDCPNTIEIEFPTNVVFCENDGNVNLPFEIIGDDSGAILWSGPCLVDPENGIINTELCGPGVQVFTLNYQIGACTYQNTLEVTIYPQPSATFEMESTACIVDGVIINYTGGVFGLANYTWDFDGAQILSGEAAGPYEVQWATAGEHTVSLLVEENGCISEVFAQTIDLTTTIDLQISCATTMSTIEFNWNEVPGAEAYDYEITGFGAGTIVENNFVIDGLFPGEEVTINITAIGADICGGATSTLTCITESCPIIDLLITPVATLCLYSNDDPIQLEVSIAGGNGTGIMSWSGAGIIDGAGLFDVNTVDVGIHEIILRYTEGVCVYESSLLIEVEGLDFNIPDTLYVCEGEYFEYCLPEEQVYEWTGPNGFSSQVECLVLPFFEENMQGTYIVSADLPGSCDLFKSIEVVMIPNGILSVTSSVEESCPHDVFELSVETAGQNVEINWHPISNVLCPDCPTTLAYITQGTNFTVQVIDETGCDWQEIIRIERKAICRVISTNDDLGGSPIDLSRADNKIIPQEGKETSKEEFSLKIYPNPVKSMLSVNVFGAEKGVLKLLNINGSKVKELNFETTQIKLDCSDLPSGTYLLQIETEKGVLVDRVVVMK